MRGILKNIQKTPERMYSKNLVTDRLTVREIINVWLGGQKQITILHLLLPFTIPQPQVLEKKQLSMWTTSGVSDPLYDPVIGHILMSTALSGGAKRTG